MSLAPLRRSPPMRTTRTTKPSPPPMACQLPLVNARVTHRSKPHAFCLSSNVDSCLSVRVTGRCSNRETASHAAIRTALLRRSALLCEQVTR
jgi:hypothetical protein